MFDFFWVSGIVVLISCPSLSTAAKQQAGMQLNLPEGFQCTAKVAVETKCHTDYYPDEQLKYRRERAVAFRCRVVERCSDGSMRIRFEYSWVRDSTSTRDPTPYDSADPNRRPGWTDRERALPALLGRSFIAEVTPEGKVRKIDGFEDFYRSVHDAVIYKWPEKVPISKAARKRWEEGEEKDFKQFFSDYWPLSEEGLKETVQQFFLIWPRQAVGKGQSWHTEDIQPELALRRANSWTVKEKNRDRVVLELASQAHTDLGLCDPNTINEYFSGSFDFLIGDCYRYQKFKYTTDYTGTGKGLFHVDPKSGMIREATWSEEFSGTVYLDDPAKGKTEPFPCPSKRTVLTSIEITNQTDEEKSGETKAGRVKK